MFSFWSSSAFWERLEYIADAIVIIGAALEYLTEFEHIFKGCENEKKRHRIGKVALQSVINEALSDHMPLGVGHPPQATAGDPNPPWMLNFDAEVITFHAGRHAMYPVPIPRNGTENKK